jgi:hypothetical protein
LVKTKEAPPAKKTLNNKFTGNKFSGKSATKFAGDKTVKPKTKPKFKNKQVAPPVVEIKVKQRPKLTNN